MLPPNPKSWLAMHPTYSKRHKHGVPGEQTWNEKRLCEAGEEPSHTNAYRLRKISSPSPKAVLPKHNPLPCCNKLTPYLASWSLLDQRGHALPLLWQSLLPTVLCKRQPSGAPRQEKRSQGLLGPARLAELPHSFTPSHLSLRYSMSLSQPGLSQEPGPIVPIAPAPQEK